MSKENPAPAKAPSTMPSTLLDRYASPLFWLAVGYGLGFFHGNSSGKRKAASAS